MGTSPDGDVETGAHDEPDARPDADARGGVDGYGGRDEPIAIVGLSCRLPGAPDPDAYWRLLCDGRSAVTEVPDGREPVGGGWGGFIDGVDRFDTAFFGISPREAALLDPQQRLMLELAWEALENARIVPGELRETATGVFVGAMRDDYALLLNRAGNAVANHHTMTGVSRGVIANRISHFLGLRGPSLVIDSGQASALVAVHTAVQSLRRGETTLAIAGAVNLNLAAETGVIAEEFGGLSPDGRCYTFDSRANGFVRGEGGGAVVLKTLSDAVASGDRVYGVVRGGAVNNDGATDGLTVPSRQAQAEVLRRAYESAGLSPAAPQYVELHGTGTPVGDPVEAGALGDVLGGARDSGRPLLVGSAKTNIGHLESAAGIAGLLKVVLAMAHGRIPASLNFEESGERLPLSELNLRVARELTEWPGTDGTRVAGVSAFGMGGTNCHLVLSDAPPAESEARDVVDPVGVVPWLVSGRSAAGLRGQAAALGSLTEASAVDVGWSLLSSRVVFEHRAVVLGSYGVGLGAVVADEPVGGVVRGVVGVVGRSVLVFPGQGAQWAGMAVELAAVSSVFAGRLAECGVALSGWVGWSLMDVLRGVEGAPSLDRVDVVQPVSFAVMVSLAALWESYGVVPSAVVGHSQGEIAAACVAGVLSLEDAARIVCLRSRAIAAVAGRGTMASIGLSAAEIGDLLAPFAGRVSVAVVNGPSQVVVSGEVAAVDELVAECGRLEIRARRIAVDYASHSAAMDVLRDELVAELAGVTPRVGRIPLMSTVTAEFIDPLTMDAEYWFRNLREPVRFADAVARLARDGYGVFVEASSHPVLTAAVEETLESFGDDAPGVVTGSLRRDDGGLDRFLANAAELWVRGVDVDWTAAFPGTTARTIDLPTYAFQRRRHWFDTVAPEGDEHEAAIGSATARLARADGAERRRILLELVRTHAAVVLGHSDAASVPPRTSFRDLGFDSQSSVRLRNRICEALSLRLPTTVLFDHPTAARLAEHLQDVAGADGPATPVVANRAPSGDPIAIVGMGCRFPGGVRSPEDLWELLRSETDAISDFPADRGWDLERLLTDPGEPGGSLVRQGGFLYDAGDFDPEFFGISPREALAMDPQQRLLLETSWEALERAGIDPSRLGGTETGVFVGAMAQEYGPRLHEAAGGVEGYALTGTTTSTMSGRIAYVLGLEGPALTVDTACSASLVAIHLAAQSLRAGECSLALAGAATVMARPGIFVEFSRQRGLSPDGRVKAFSDRADGTGWGEGVGTIVLERLSDARRNGHRVLAVLAGTAVNSDGASNGLTAPNGPSQQRVIRQALANAGLQPSDVDAVEAHGTGTVLGDPIEAAAIIDVYGRDRAPDRPLWLGSAKTNIGHTQAAAGLAGVIKTVQSIRYGLLPRTLHADPPSSHVDWSAGTVRLLTEPVPWPETGGPRRAGVSAFGVSGTNAHVIIAEQTTVAGPIGAIGPVHPPHPATESPRVLPYVLSARTPEALREQAIRLRGALRAQNTWRPADLAHTLATGRARFAERAVVLAPGHAELDRALTALAEDGEAADVVRGVPVGDGRIVFVFPGQGGQWRGMATGLLDASPVFAARIAECDAALAEFVDWSLTDVLRDAPGAPSLDRVDVVQPALFATMVSLAALWRSYGVEPAAVVGHSQGEIAAACVAGALSLPDAARVVSLRSRALSTTLAGHGAMASVFQPVDRVTELLRPWGSRISIAATNGPRAVVVSGERAAVAELLAKCADSDIHARNIPVDYASHSAQVEFLQDELATLLAPIRPRPSEVPFHSTVTATVLDGTELTADYWYRNLRSTVRFDEVARQLAESGHRVFVEASPHPTLTMAVRETVESTGATDGVAIGSLRRDDGGVDRFLASLAEAHTHGVEPEWATVFAGLDPRTVDLPTYPFARERYWWTPPPGAEAPGRAEAAHGPAERWRYDIAWRPVRDTAAGTLAGRWLVVTPTADDETYAEVAAALRAAGADPVAIPAPAGTPDHDTLVTALTTGDAIGGVLSLLALDEGAGPAAGVAGLVALLRASGAAGATAPIWCATRGAVVTGPSDPPPGLAGAALWAAGRAAALEHPREWGGLVDLPARWDGRARERLAAVLAGAVQHGGEDQIAIRPAGLLARRLVRAARTASPAPARPPRGTVLITGGTGSLGIRLARRLAEGGAERVLLVSRSGGDPAAVEALATELRESAEVLERAAERGTAFELTAVACDVTDRAALESLLAGIGPDRPLTAVHHAAGVCELGPLTETTPERLSAVLDAKVLGAVQLDALTADLELDAFVVFSSISGTWGVTDHGVYGAANACLDALAARRRARGARATSIAWGPWGGGGMIDPGLWDTLAASGVPVLDPEPALDALRTVLDHDETTVAVADVDWDRFVPVFTTARPSPLLRELVDTPTDTPASTTGPQPVGALHTLLEGLQQDEQRELVLGLVREHTAKVLGHTRPETIAGDRAFKEIGFDSLTAVGLRDRLAAATGSRLPTTLIFDHPSPAALAEHLWREAVGDAPETVTAGTATATDEPLAIVGMACRLPGDIGGPEQLWRLLAAAGDAIGGLPTDRGWDIDALYDPDPDRHGTSYTRAGGFLHRAAEFDHDFFGISAREALAMDPQQRLLLETTWEAFESAGLVPAELKGSDTGVFAGVLAPDYGQPHGMPGELEGYHVTGGAPSVASGRLAYTFGLVGPAVTVDTACSSSLVALHLAAQALRSGECERALVAGASVMSTPTPMISFSRQRALSTDGRCRSFAEDADGFGMAEGVGVLLVERLSTARRDGHRVLAVVRGSAVNSDGASNGLTAPNGPSQQRVIRKALANAGLAATDIDAVEAHGTGTRLGDPIEAQALLATYGADRPADRPLWLGSAKSNLGHTQAAAGVVGVIKMVQSMRYGTLPSTLHADEPTSRVDWESGGIRLLTEARPWPETGRPHRAGVSAFGISGTNAHVILEQAPIFEQSPILEQAPDEPPTPAAGPAVPGAVPWLLTARTPEALRDQATSLVALAEPTDRAADPYEVGRALATTRARFDHRAVIVGAPSSDASGTSGPAALTALAAGAPEANTVTGVVGPLGRTVFVFPGQGSQWDGMAVRLAAESPVFAARLAECETALAEFVDWSLADVLRGAEGAPTLERVDVVQPASFAVMVSLAALWRSYGVEPAAVVGHSQGEIAAACVAGALSLRDAARVVCLRSRAITAVAGQGAMAMIALPVADIAELLSPYDGVLSVAAVNSPRSVVLSGDRAALEELVHTCQREQRVRARMIPVDYASHSGHVEPILGELAELLAPITPRRPEVPMYSTVAGDWIDTAALDAAYWCVNLRQPVRFAEAVGELGERGYGLFVECSPHPVLLAAVEETTGHLESVRAVGSLRRDDGGAERFLLSLGEAWTHGAPVDWNRFFTGSGTGTGTGTGGTGALVAGRVELPTYPFRRTRHWIEAPAETAARRRSAVIDGWRYRVAWTPVPTAGTPVPTAGTSVPTAGTPVPTTGTPGPGSGDWIVVTPAADVHPGLVRTVLDGLARHGVTVHPVTTRELTTGRARLPRDIAGVLSLAALDTRPATEAGESSLTTGLADTVAIVRALADIAPDAPLWLATRTAVGTAGTDPVGDPAQAQIWGLGVVLGLDEPHRACGQIDLPAEPDDRTIARLAEVITGTSGENEIALRDGAALGRRLVPAPAGAADPWRPRGTVLITGGTGALGAHLARWAARSGAERLVLTSRRGAEAPGAKELYDELTELGATVTLAACDVADADALAAVIAAIPATEPLTAVVHAAGLTQAEIPVAELTTDELARVIRAKVDGARHLDTLTAGLELDAFVLFSSGAGTWGDSGKGGYAAANAHLDALAQERRARGAVATAVAWGAWDGGGMVEGEIAELLNRRGVRLMRPELAVEALAVAVGAGDTTIAIASFDLARFLPLYTMNRPRRLVAELTAAQDRAPGDGGAPPEPGEPTRGTALAERLAGLPGDEQETMLIDVIRREAAAVLKTGRAEEIQPRRAFKEIGFDSLTALEFRNRLNAATGLRLPPTTVFDHPNPAALAQHLRGEIGGGPGDALDELTRLEAGFAALTTDDRTRLDIADRLRALLRRVEPAGASTTTDEPGDVLAAVNGDLAEASNDEIFDLIDRELGI
ncbi:SDR family NAD(P)-dependent oxidoreductase [Streptomyces sp. NPDC020965]|uniref:SDR family NAD(P)-dependent oxidoreductase n=1 Tax=Streptomyces sp. NPDC020965 TaxID=3365105 RepID=UPI0037B5248C